METSTMQRVKTWVHDSLIVLGVVVVSLFCGASELFGYWWAFEFLPMK